MAKKYTDKELEELTSFIANTQVRLGGAIAMITGHFEAQENVIHTELNNPKLFGDKKFLVTTILKPLTPELKKIIADKKFVEPEKFVMDAFRTRDLKDLYFLDELVKDMHKAGVSLNGGWKYGTFLRDWYHELWSKVNHTDEERQTYLVDNFGQEWVDEGHFLTTEERDNFLKNNL